MSPGIAIFLATVSASASAHPSLLPDSLHWDTTSFYGLTVKGDEASGNKSTPRFEKIHFDEIGLGESAFGRRVKTLVEDTLAQAFGSARRPPNYTFLSQAFPGKDCGILKGKVLPGKDDTVQYYWVTPQEWLHSLQAMTRAGKRFEVALSIIWVYQDPTSSNRYWATVKQSWTTRRPDGSVAYADDGFLFLNFDLDEHKNPRNIKIDYRLWFYDYKHPDAKRGLKRYQRMAQDIEGALDSHSQVPVNFGRLEGDRWVRDDQARGISGVNRDLLERMKTDLVEGIKAGRGE